MQELYDLIEQKIRESGCPVSIDGAEFYDDMNAEADNQEIGTYIFIIKKDDNLSYNGCMTIMDEEFDLHYVDIHVGDQKYHVDFDA